jgi:predicted glycogen debranching enzyme
LSTNFWRGGDIAPQSYRWLRSFTLDPFPTWTWQQQDWQLTRQIVLLDGDDRDHWSGWAELGQGRSGVACQAAVKSSICHRVLVHYDYTGPTPAMLQLRPLIADRDWHQPMHRSPEQQFSQVIGVQHLWLQAIQAGQVGTPWQLSWTQGHYQPDAAWYLNYHYPEETQRGLSDAEDLYSPGYLSVGLQPGDRVTVTASVSFDGIAPPCLCNLSGPIATTPAPQVGQQPLASTPFPISSEKLRQAGDRHLSWRTTTGSPTIITGYPWFRDQGRFILLALPGLTLATQRFELARAILAALARSCHHGLMPNGFGEAGNQPIYNSLDISLWWIETLGLYLTTTQDWAFLREQYATVKQIYKALTAGSLYNIRVDAADGLISWEAPQIALTWMDAMVAGQPVTPRQGKPIEVNALWYSALCWATQWANRLGRDDPHPALANQAHRYATQAEQVKQSLQRFWRSEPGYLGDVIDAEDRCDGTIRPNAVLAISLSHCAFSPAQVQAILQVARDRLLTPYGLRTLDPADPAYIGHYHGSPWQRELAAHQGTVWSWLMGPFCRAWQRYYPDRPLPLDGQLLADHFAQAVCLETISELFDGDAPHQPRGAIAHVGAIAELLRLQWPLPIG